MKPQDEHFSTIRSPEGEFVSKLSPQPQRSEHKPYCASTSSAQDPSDPPECNCEQPPATDDKTKVFTHHNTCPRGERCACYITGYTTAEYDHGLALDTLDGDEQKNSHVKEGVADDPPTVQSSTDDRVKEQGSHAARQWTLLDQVGMDIRLYAHDDKQSWKYLVRLCGSYESAKIHTPRFIEAVNREVNRLLNAALEAEREKQRQVDWDELAKLENRLLQAQAVIAELRHLLIGLRFWLQGSLNCKSHVWEPDQRVAATEVLNDAIKVEHSTVDLSALDKHVTGKTQPLVDCINELLETSRDVAVGVFPTEAHLQARKKAVALAKVSSDAKTDRASDSTLQQP